MILKTIKDRRSVRLYDENKEISDETISKILEHGHYAPSSKNSQPWYFVVIKNKKLIHKIMNAKTPERPEGKNLLIDQKEFNETNIPKAIVAIFFEKRRSIFVDPRFYGGKVKSYFLNVGGFAYSDLVNIGCVLQTMALTAHHLGIGACITGDLLETGINPEIYDWVKINKKDFQLVSGIRFGYPKNELGGKPNREPLNDRVKVI